MAALLWRKCCWLAEGGLEVTDLASLGGLGWTSTDTRSVGSVALTSRWTFTLEGALDRDDALLLISWTTSRLFVKAGVSTDLSF